MLPSLPPFRVPDALHNPIVSIARYLTIYKRIARYIDTLLGCDYDKSMSEDKLFSLDSQTARAIAARRKPKTRQCPVCGKEFVTVGRGLYDDPKCARKAAYTRLKQRRSGFG